MRRASRTDDNHAAIRDGLRELPGISVADTSDVGNGYPDLTVGWMGVNYLLEIKDGNKSPSRRQLTPGQDGFHAGWAGQIDVVCNLDEALKVLGLM